MGVSTLGLDVWAHLLALPKDRKPDAAHEVGLLTVLESVKVARGSE